MIYLNSETKEFVGKKHRNDPDTIVSYEGAAIKGISTFIITTIICQLYSLLLLIIIIIFTS